ncbi:MAG: hypothetical protein AB1805_16575 [Nitrospirota bacterium]
MRGFFKRVEAAMMAVAFAEEGEAETARQLLEHEPQSRTRQPATRSEKQPTLGKELWAD